MLSTNKISYFAMASLLAAMVGGAQVTAHADQQNPISVTVDSQPVEFTGAQPMETGGSVLVPLRGVFEALHARVDYDSSNQTITANRGDQNVQVTIGSNRAMINGQPDHISQPAEIVDGSTMVPLRFVAEALGDYVEWSGSTSTVSITRQDDHSPMAGNSPAMESDNNPNIVTGRFQRVVSGQDLMQIEIRAHGQVTTVPLSHDVLVQRGKDKDSVVAVSLNELQPGDRVIVHENDHGRGERVTAFYGQDGM